MKPSQTGYYQKFSPLENRSFGDRNFYDSVTFCNRCGSCIQVCPTYQLTGLETHAPRGRNQAVRLILERKLKYSDTLQDSFNACTLCGRCTQACGAKIPTAQHVLHMQQTIAKRRLPALLQALLSLRGRNSVLFQHVVKIGFALRPLWKILACLPGLNWLKLAATRLEKKPLSLLAALEQAHLTWSSKNPKLIYLPSLEAEFIEPQIAVSSLKILNRDGRTDCWLNTPTGLFEYVYGDVRQSKRLLRRLIRKYNTATYGTLPLVTDSLDVYHFLKQAPQLFNRHKRLTFQAQQLAEKLHFITEFFPKNISAADRFAQPVQLEMGSLFSRESAPILQSFSLLKTLFKQNFVECEYTAFDTPAFGYPFSAGNQNERMMVEVVKQIARKQTKTIFTFSGLCALELNEALRRFYPAAKAQHIVYIADKK